MPLSIHNRYHQVYALKLMNLIHRRVSAQETWQYIVYVHSQWTSKISLYRKLCPLTMYLWERNQRKWHKGEKNLKGYRSLETFSAIEKMCPDVSLCFRASSNYSLSLWLIFMIKPSRKWYSIHSGYNGKIGFRMISTQNSSLLTSLSA